MKTFKETISKSIEKSYNVAYPENLVYVGNWTRSSVNAACDKALVSDATTVVSLGYLSSIYMSQKKDKKKFVVTVDQYGLRGIGDSFFDPVEQNIDSFATFKKITNFKKTAVLINENFYNNRKDWKELIAKRFKEKNIVADVVPIPVGHNIDKVMSSIDSDVDAVFITPLFNLSVEERKTLIGKINERKLLSFSTTGKEDVELGVLLGSGEANLDQRLAEATTFNIQGVLYGHPMKSEKASFFEDKILYFNADTAEALQYQPHLRVLYTAEVITKKPVKTYDLTAIFETLAKQNLDIERKSLLVQAAERSALSAKLRYLPTLAITLGYQGYNHDYAATTKNIIPERTGVFSIGMDQIIYSPALVTNILVKNRMVDFSKAEQFLMEQNMGIKIAHLYIETLMLQNVVKIQEEYVNESRKNLTMARVRQYRGDCDNEEVMRWASQLSVNEQHLLDLRAELKNVKITINKLLFENQKDNFELAPLKATDRAFFTSDIHVINYITTPQSLEKFTQMLVKEAIRVAPELAKLRAAVKMKDHEMSMYIQKFILPDAKLSLEYTSLFGREFGSPTNAFDAAKNYPIKVPGTSFNQLYGPAEQALSGVTTPTNGRIGIFAQWKPIEGGHKFAEIARIKAEKKELQRYMDEASISIEQHVREVINRALASYLSIQKNYKAMITSQENYNLVRKLYAEGKAPIAQLIDAQQIYLDSKLKAINSQYEFFKELVWVQRGICSINWVAASEESKKFIQSLKDELPNIPDYNL